MKTQTQLLLELWKEARTRFSDQMATITASDLIKKLLPSQNLVGSLIRHIGEVELLFAKNIFGAANTKISAITVKVKNDTGERTNLKELKDFVAQSFEALKSIIKRQTDADLQTEVITKKFDTKTKAEAFGRIVSHTTYYAGQLALILKYN